MKEVEQYLKGRRSIVQRELTDLEAKVESMTLEVKELTDGIEWQQQLGEKHEEVT